MIHHGIVAVAPALFEPQAGLLATLLVAGLWLRSFADLAKMSGTGQNYESQLASLAEVAHCERSENRGSGGGGLKTDHFEALPHLILVAMAVDFEADVPCGNWVTVGFDPPLVRPSLGGDGNGE